MGGGVDQLMTNSICFILYDYQENLPNESGSDDMEKKPLVTDKILRNIIIIYVHLYLEIGAQ